WGWGGGVSVGMGGWAGGWGGVRGWKPPWRPLSSMLSAVRKNGRMVSPDTVASSFTNAEKSIAVMLRAPHRCRHSTTEDRHVRQPPPRLVGPAAPGEVALHAPPRPVTS